MAPGGTLDRPTSRSLLLGDLEISRTKNPKVVLWYYRIKISLENLMSTGYPTRWVFVFLCVMVVDVIFLDRTGENNGNPPGCPLVTPTKI